MLTADYLRKWADHMDNPAQCPRPDGPNPALVVEALVMTTLFAEGIVLAGTRKDGET